MILGTISQPKTKTDLIRRLQQLKSIQFTMMEDVVKKDMPKIKTEIERYISQKEATIIVIKQR